MVVSGGVYMYGVSLESPSDINKLIDLGVIKGDKVGNYCFIEEDFDEFCELIYDYDNYYEFMENYDDLFEFLDELKGRLEKLKRDKIYSEHEKSFIANVERLKHLENIRDCKSVINDIKDNIYNIYNIVHKEVIEDDVFRFGCYLYCDDKFFLERTPHSARWTEYGGNVIYFGVGTYIYFGNVGDLSEIKLDKDMFDKFCSDNNLFLDREIDFEFFPNDCNCCS